MLDLVFDRWLAIGDRERRALAEALVRELPGGFRLVGVRGTVATFAQHRRTFALVPGGAFTLGWEPGSWQPADDERASFEDSADEYGFEHDVIEHVARATLRQRAVVSASLLVETSASELGWTPADHDEPDVRDATERLRSASGPYTSIVSGGVSEVRVHRTAEGTIVAERSIAGATHAVLTRELAADGFRFPTSDEWELICGVGAPSLFRWGDHAPCDRYPIDVSPAEAAWRREWVLSRGTLERPPGGFSSDFERHVEPNRLGLLIASDPYKCELVAEPDRTRGGDGGSMICGGAGFFLGWLTLATAYFEEHACLRDPADPISPGYTVGRRVLPLG